MGSTGVSIGATSAIVDSGSTAILVSSQDAISIHSVREQAINSREAGHACSASWCFCMCEPLAKACILQQVQSMQIVLQSINTCGSGKAPSCTSSLRQVAQHADHNLQLHLDLLMYLCIMLDLQAIPNVVFSTAAQMYTTTCGCSDSCLESLPNLTFVLGTNGFILEPEAYIIKVTMLARLICMLSAAMPLIASISCSPACMHYQVLRALAAIMQSGARAFVSSHAQPAMQASTVLHPFRLSAMHC